MSSTTKTCFKTLNELSLESLEMVMSRLVKEIEFPEAETPMKIGETKVFNFLQDVVADYKKQGEQKQFDVYNTMYASTYRSFQNLHNSDDLVLSNSLIKPIAEIHHKSVSLSLGKALMKTIEEMKEMGKEGVFQILSISVSENSLYFKVEDNTLEQCIEFVLTFVSDADTYRKIRGVTHFGSSGV